MAVPGLDPGIVPAIHVVMLQIFDTSIESGSKMLKIWNFAERGQISAASRRLNGVDARDNPGSSPGTAMTEEGPRSRNLPQ